MYDFAIVALLALATLKLVDFLTDAIPQLRSLRSLMTFMLSPLTYYPAVCPALLKKAGATRLGAVGYSLSQVDRLMKMAELGAKAAKVEDRGEDAAADVEDADAGGQQRGADHAARGGQPDGRHERRPH